MFNLLKRQGQENGPYWINITVPEPLAEKLGFKTKISNFYLISDKKTKNLGDPPSEYLKENISNTKPSFRGIYCSAGVEQVSDIKADLQKYCDLMGVSGLTLLNGKEVSIIPTKMQGRSNSR